MRQSQDSDGISLCSDTAETLINRDQDEKTSLSNNIEDGLPDVSDQKSTITVAISDDPMKIGTPAYPSIRNQMLFDLSLSVPAVLFAVYGLLAIYHDGESVNTASVSNLKRASIYGPTIFPIAFAAVASNLLKAIAAWKLERGIAVLSLESLLRSRTVFSSIASPISLKAFSSLNILIMALWALSPLGGQATLRVRGEGTSTQDWKFWYLDIRNNLPYQSLDTFLGSSELAQTNAAFSAALSSPIQIKTAKQDVFGHVKIPMVEPYLANGTADQDGWYQVDGDNTKIVYSSLAGLPITPDDGFEQDANYNFRLNTSYINATCELANSTPEASWEEYVASRFPANLFYNTSDGLRRYTNLTVYSNNKTLLLESPHRQDVYTQPQELIITSYVKRPGTITNRTCVLKTTHVELELACDRSTCTAAQIRHIKTPKRDTMLTVLDGKNTADFLSDALNNNTLQEKQLSDPDMADLGSAYLPTNGTRTTSIPTLKVNRPWLGVLMISSFFMLLAALAAAVLNTLRRGPDILDNPIRLMKDSPYMYTASETTSMENGVDYTRRMKHVRVCLGDAKADEKLGRIAIGTTDQVVPLHKQSYTRLYE